ncbi:hypothetical protein BofuT4_P000250.1 [Botrytis cinerea T4]|uniref:Uncharacterized protein n=1 Tax=Botryotinia fuckeliana (strain T4) TaxID=999810 RepID=G2YLT0_BOTF4|nr:hypothetical protein BofuT4_P000250.1 [Botrytis cinerea T4]
MLRTAVPSQIPKRYVAAPCFHLSRGNYAGNVSERTKSFPSTASSTAPSPAPTLSQH